MPAQKKTFCMAGRTRNQTLLLCLYDQRFQHLNHVRFKKRSLMLVLLLRFFKHCYHTLRLHNMPQNYHHHDKRIASVTDLQLYPCSVYSCSACQHIWQIRWSPTALDYVDNWSYFTSLLQHYFMAHGHEPETLKKKERKKNWSKWLFASANPTYFQHCLFKFLFSTSHMRITLLNNIAAYCLFNLYPVLSHMVSIIFKNQVRFTI